MRDAKQFCFRVPHFYGQGCAALLPAVEVSANQIKHGFRLVDDLRTECFVCITAQFTDDAIYHSRTEHVVLFEYVALILQAVRRRFATNGALCSRFQFGFTLFPVNIDVDICILGNGQCIGFFKTVTACYGQSGQ